MKIEQIWQDLITEKVIGKGSYGTVYKCYRENNGEKEYSAVKVITIPQTGEEYYGYNTEGMTIEQTKEYYRDIVDDFANEIKILESLKGNKNIVEIKNYEVIEKTEEIGWEIFIEMELLTDFNTYASDKVFTEEEVLKLGTDLCNALYVCNDKNIIHRDIKPENIFVSDTGDFKLGDFGVSRQLEKTDASMSRKGTFNYMAPEVFYSKKYDSRADVYSLGLVMYKLLNNNRMPFLDAEKQIIKYSERQEAFDKRINGEKIPAIKGISDELNEVILKACEYKAEDRYNSADEFRKALEKRKLTGFAGWIYRHKIVVRASIIALVVLSLSVSVAIALKFGNDKPEDTVVDGGDPGIVDYVYMESGEVYTKNPINGKYVYTNSDGVFIYNEENNETTQVCDIPATAPAYNSEEICFVSAEDNSIYVVTEEKKKAEKIVETGDVTIAEISYFDDECVIAQRQTSLEDGITNELVIYDIASQTSEVIADLGVHLYVFYAQGNVVYLENAVRDALGLKMYAYNIGDRENKLIAENAYGKSYFAQEFDGSVFYLTHDEEDFEEEKGFFKLAKVNFDGTEKEYLTDCFGEYKELYYWDNEKVFYGYSDGKSFMLDIASGEKFEIKTDGFERVEKMGDKYYLLKMVEDNYQIFEIKNDASVTFKRYTENLTSETWCIAFVKNRILVWDKSTRSLLNKDSYEADPLLITATEDDWKRFKDSEFFALLYHVNYCNYDSKKIDSKTFFLEYVLEGGGHSEVFPHYNFNYNEYSFDAKPDPKKRFKYSEQYYDDSVSAVTRSPGTYAQYSTDYVKWLSENIFNVKFEIVTDFSYGESDELKDGYVYSQEKEPYYHEGYYYVATTDFGDGGNDVYLKIDNKTYRPDGTVLVDVTSYYTENDEKVDSFTILVGLKNIDGKNYWSIYELVIDATVDGELYDDDSSKLVLPDPLKDKVRLMFDETGEYVVGIEAEIYGDYDTFVDRDDIFASVTVDDLLSSSNGVDVYNNEVYYFYTDKTFVQGCRVIDDVEESYEEHYSDGYEVEFNDGYTTIKLYLNKQYLAEDVYPDFGFDFEIREGVLYNSSNQATNYAVNVEDFYRVG